MKNIFLNVIGLLCLTLIFGYAERPSAPYRGLIQYIPQTSDGVTYA